MKPVELAKDIFWIGAVDYNKRNFHGYSRSPRGTTYNSYLVRDEKNVVFDTVDNDYAGTMFCRLAKLMPLDKVDYIVVNHTEKDHAGACTSSSSAASREDHHVDHRQAFWNPVRHHRLAHRSGQTGTSSTSLEHPF
ncbi:MAG: hypothetical protein ACLSHC_10520 [Bilophila wadsworthia]